MPSAAAINEVRRLTKKALELCAYMHRPEVVAERRKLYGLEPMPALREPTEAEVLEAAARIDAGEIFNVRLWQEQLRSPAVQARVAA